MKTLVVIGPQRSGKTTHAEYIRSHYGLDRIIDEPVDWAKVPSEGALVLANEPPPITSGFKVVSMELISKKLCLTGGGSEETRDVIQRESTAGPEKTPKRVVRKNTASKHKRDS